MPLVVEHGDREEVVLGEEAGERLLVHRLVRGDDVGVHDVPHGLVGRRRKELAERDHADEPLLAVEHVDVVDGLEALARLPAQVGDRLVDAHVGPQPRVARVHEPAGLVLLVGQQRGDFLARRLVEHREQPLALLLGRLLDDVGGVVRGQEPHPGAPVPGRHLEDDLRLVPRRQGQQELLRLGVREDPQAFEPLLGREDRPGFLELGREDAALARLLDARGRHDAGRRTRARRTRHPLRTDGLAENVGCATLGPPPAPGPADDPRLRRGRLPLDRTALAVATHIRLVPTGSSPIFPARPRMAVTALAPAPRGT